MNGIYDEILNILQHGDDTYPKTDAKLICEVIAQHLKGLGRNFTKNGYPACGRALKLEADTILAD